MYVSIPKLKALIAGTLIAKQRMAIVNSSSFYDIKYQFLRTFDGAEHVGVNIEQATDVLSSPAYV
jgi:hypothetical protein